MKKLEDLKLDTTKPRMFSDKPSITKYAIVDQNDKVIDVFFNLTSAEYMCDNYYKDVRIEEVYED